MYEKHQDREEFPAHSIEELHSRSMARERDILASEDLGLRAPSMTSTPPDARFSRPINDNHESV